MLVNTGNNQTRRVLQKVRVRFLNKRPEVDQEIAAPVPAEPEAETFNLIDPLIGIVEKDRKMHIGYQFIRSNLEITNILIETVQEARVITLNIHTKDTFVPWQDAVERLESFGDLELATWARKIRNYYGTYSKRMEAYYELVKTADTEMYANMGKSKNQARVLVKTLELKCMYHKVTLFANESSLRILSITYSEGLLIKTGYDMANLSDWVKENGLPMVFESDGVLGLYIIDLVLNCSPYDGEYVKESPELFIYLLDKEGNKHEAVAQHYCISECLPEGIFFTVIDVFEEGSHNRDESSAEKMLSKKNSELKQKKRKYEEKDYSCDAKDDNSDNDRDDDEMNVNTNDKENVPSN